MHCGSNRRERGSLVTSKLFLVVGLFAAWLVSAAVRADEPAKLIAHWPLSANARDVVGSAHGKPLNVKFGSGDAGSAKTGAFFNGRDSRIEVPDSKTLDVGTRDFSLAAWVRCEMPYQSVLGDLVSKFDPLARRGINLHLSASSPAYSASSDTRHVHFGIDDAYLSDWEDHGRPWPSNSLVSNLVAFNGELYCGIADADQPQDRAHVFRFAGGKKWVDCGRLGENPDHHSVMSMAVHDGKLYAGTGIWDWQQAQGGVKNRPAAALTRVFVYEGGTRWRDLGQVGSGSRVLSLTTFKGSLYAGIDKVGKGHAYRYDAKSKKWIDCGSPDGRNLESFVAWGGTLFVATHGNVYAYENEQSWKRIASDPYDINQIHCMQVFGGKLVIGTWPQGYVLRYAGGQNWDKMGRLGLPEGQPLINEIMDLTVYNGKLYTGIIPNAEVFRYETDGHWTQLGSLARRSDWDPNPKQVATWVRVTCVSAFQGRLFVGIGSCQGRALDAPADPSLGRVKSMQAGQVVSHERDIGGAWTHVAAIRRGKNLELYINGKLSSSSTLRAGAPFNLSNSMPLLIGNGVQNAFHGSMSDLKFYEGALDVNAVQTLARTK